MRNESKWKDYNQGKFFIITALFLLLYLSPNFATTYYVCDCQTGADADCRAGDDDQAGTDPSSPWQSYEKAAQMFSSLEPGDTIAFSRGSSFFPEASQRWVNNKCTAAEPCVVTAYTPPWASGDEALPLINQAGFRLEDGGNANHEEGYSIEKLHLLGPSEDNGFFIYNDIDDVILDSLIIDGFSIGVHCAGSNPPEPESNGKNERITLRNSRIRNCGGQGFLGGGDDLVIENNLFDNNGFEQAVFNHNIYVSGASDTITKRIRVSGNRLYRSAIVEGECAGVSLVVHGQHDSLIIENNIVWEDVGAAGQGCWGIAADGGYDSEEQFSNTIIRGNTIINVGNMGIGMSSGPGSIIENNIIIHQQDFPITAIAMPDRTRGEEDVIMTGVTVRNNTVYIANGDNGGTGIFLGSEGSDHVSVSNAVVYAGSSTSFRCFRYDLPASNYTAIDNNLAFATQLESLQWETETGSLTEWRSATSFDEHSIIADPLFPSEITGSNDLKIGDSLSPLIGAGHSTLSAPTDRNGVNREGSPDIGAWEYGTQKVRKGKVKTSPSFFIQYIRSQHKMYITIPQRIGSDAIQLTLYSALGRRLLHRRIPVYGGNRCVLDTKGLPSGVSFLHIEDKKGGSVGTTCFLSF